MLGNVILTTFFIDQIQDWKVAKLQNWVRGDNQSLPSEAPKGYFYGNAPKKLEGIKLFSPNLFKGKNVISDVVIHYEVSLFY